MITVLSAGDSLYKYVLERKVGGGNFGEVWVAEDRSVGRKLAIKILDESMAPVAASLNEARLGNKLNHDNVVRLEYADVVNFGSGKLVVIAMDLHENGSALSLLNSAGFIPAPKAVQAMIDVLRGLEYLHERNLLHNDIKPSNILLGQDSRAILTDYGISSHASIGASTPAPNAYLLHRAPETGSARSISVASDVYQAGLTLFRLINGIDILEAHLSRVGHAEFERLKAAGEIPYSGDFKPFIDPRLKRIVLKASSADPKDRYESALHMRRDLERLRLPGYWDINSAGVEEGILGNYKYTFAMRSIGGEWGLTAYRENLVSSRRTRISAHCQSGLTKTQADKAVGKFMLAVVRGSV